MSKKTKAIWLACRPSNMAECCTGSICAVAFPKTYVVHLLGRMELAERESDRCPSFFGITYFDPAITWLSRLAGDAEDPLNAQLDALQDTIAEGRAWHELPAGWEPQDRWEQRTELVTVTFTKEDFFYSFYEKHVDQEMETPELQTKILQDMLGRLS